MVSRDRRGGHRAGGDRDDGQPLDPRRRGRHQRRLPARRGRRARGGARRRARPSARPASRGGGHLRARGGGSDPRRKRRGRARADLEGAQGSFRGDGPHRAELLRAGQRDPAHAARRGAAARSTSWRREYDLQVANVFHAGDGNLHPLVCYDGSQARRGRARRGAGRADRARPAWTQAARSPASTASAWTRSATCRRCSDEPDLAAFQRLRCAFDPDSSRNPGKVMPTPRLCGEVPGPYRRHPLEQAGLAERF